MKGQDDVLKQHVFHLGLEAGLHLIHSGQILYLSCSKRSPGTMLVTTGPPGKRHSSVFDTGSLHVGFTPFVLLLCFCHTAPPWRHLDWSLPTVRRDAIVLSPSVFCLQSGSYHHY